MDMTTNYESISSVGVPPQEAVRMGFGRLLGALARLATPDLPADQRVEALGTAHDFIGALIEATNAAPSEGEAADFAAKLRALYAFWGSSLAGMGYRTDQALLEQVRAQVREMAVAWDTMLRAEAPAIV